MGRGPSRAAKPQPAAATAAAAAESKAAPVSKQAAAAGSKKKQQQPRKGSNKSAPIEIEDEDEQEHTAAAAAEEEPEESKEPPRPVKSKSKRTTELSRLADSLTAAAASSSAAAAAATSSDSGSDGAANGGSIACGLRYEVEPGGGVPVFRPTMEQFKDFAKFIEIVNNVGHWYGLAKVIPPPEFIANPSAFENVDLSKFLIHSPVRQQVSKTAVDGAYTVRAMEEPSIVSITVPAFQGLTVQAEAARSGTEKKLVADQDWEGLERQFWRATMYNAPMYGADSPGTLFDPAVQAWNVAALPSLLHALSYKIPGVTLPFLYFGQWKSMFAFHKEDVNLYSINYLHVGAPKQWYGIPPRYAAAFDSKAHLCYADARRSCTEYMRHKEQLVNPSTLKKWLIPYIHTRQHRGEFMLTWPTAYHQGFNYGFNCAESVNFATNSWIPFGTNCGRCLCKTDTVWVEVGKLKERLRCLQWLYRAEQKQRRGAKQLTPADVPASYVLDESSVWLGLPTEVPVLRALAQKYYPNEEQDEAAGRSMSASAGGGGRSMAAASAASSSSSSSASGSPGYMFDERSYNDMETNTYDESNGYMDDANASVCTYADCTQPLHPNQRALIHHYQTVHSAAARAAAAASSAAAAAASSGATVAAAAVPTPAAAAAASGASKKKPTAVSGSKRKSAAEPTAAAAPTKPAASRSSAAAADSPASKKQKQAAAAPAAKTKAKASSSASKRR